MHRCRALCCTLAFALAGGAAACNDGSGPNDDDGLPDSTASVSDTDPTTCVTGVPELLPDFPTLMAALARGERVRVVLDYDRCLLDGSRGPDAVGGMNIDNWEHFAAGVVGNAKAYVATSQTQFVQFASGPALNYVRVRAYEDGAVDVTAQYLDPTSYDVTMNEVFACTIDTGDGNGGAAFLAPPRPPAEAG